MQGNDIYAKKSDGTVTAGMSGSSDGIRFFAGSDETTKESAPYRVYETGKVWMTDAHVEGDITAGSISFRTIRGGGDMDGYSFGMDPGEYILPPPAAFKQVHIFGGWPPYNIEDKLIVRTSGLSMIAEYNPDTFELSLLESKRLYMHTMYTITCMPAPDSHLSTRVHYVWVVSKSELVN